MATSEKSTDEPLNWPDARQFRRSIRFQFAAVVSLLTAILLTITGYGFSRLYTGAITKSEIEKLLIEARSFSAPTGKLMIAGNSADDLLLQNVCKRLKTESPEVFWVGVGDSEGYFKAHTDITQVVNRSQVRSFSSSDFSELLRTDEQFLLQGDTIFVNVPIRENAVILGTLSLASSSAAIAKARRDSLITVLGVFVIMLPLSIIFPTFALRRQLRPVKIIADSLKSISFESAQVIIPYSSKNEFGFLAETLRSMGKRLEIARLELAERERMARELEIAKEIQMSILPRTYPRSERFSTAGAYRSAREVGGDYFDFIRLSDHRYGILVADVAGKSLPGMLVMLMTRDLVKNYAMETDDPKELLCKVNRELYQNIREGMFVTMIYAILDEELGTIVIASAGHNPIALMREGQSQPELVKCKGFPLALMTPDFFHSRLEACELTLSGGDTLILYTDGITEAQNAAHDEFGIERLVQTLKLNSRNNSNELVNTVMSDLDAFVGDAEQYDDITVVAVKWEGSAGTSVRRKSEGAIHAG